MAKMIREAAGAAKTGPGRVKLTLITPGQGSSGFYSAEVLEQAAQDRVFPRGTQSHINHDTAIDRMDRPEGNLRNLAGVLLEDAYVDTDGALVAETRIGSAWRDFVEDFGEFIGASIVASAEVTEAKGGPVIERLIPSPFNRADLVTVAGRGGRIAEVLEAAQAIESRSIVRETTANDVESYLRAAVRDAHRTDDEYAWLQDYDDTSVYYDTGGRTYKQGYTLDGVNVTLTGEPVEVRRRVEYDPITPTPAVESKSPLPVPAGVQEKKEAATMATTTIEEVELATLRESASRATAAEAEITTATQRATVAEAALTAANDTAAAAIVEAAFTAAGITAPKTAAKLSKGYPVAESGALDRDALEKDVAESIAELAEAGGAGTPRGVGETTVTESGNEPGDDDILGALKGGK